MTSTVKAVKDAEPDPKKGKPRSKSGVSFPYFDLDASVEVARVIHERAGGMCDRAQLAALLQYSGVANGSFLSRVAAAKMFGLVEDTEDGKLRVAARGRAIVAPISPPQETQARVDAFLGVELFGKVYTQFNGTTLPENVGLKNLLATGYQVVAERIAPTVRVMLNSADQAGLFRATGDRSRMVMPLVGAYAPPPLPPEKEKPAAGGGGGGGSGDDPPDIDPALLGLLRRLPAVGTTLNDKRRKAVIGAFTAFVDLVYPDADDET